MLVDVINDPAFATMMQSHIRSNVGYLLSHDEPFGVVCRIEHVHFDPPLPEPLRLEFRPLTLFFLAGYTYESAYLGEDALRFEAGFGDENFGSMVHVPLLAIVQIVVDDVVIAINHAPFIEAAEEGIQNSMKALLSNPENQKFLKKSKS